MAIAASDVASLSDKLNAFGQGLDDAECSFLAGLFGLACSKVSEEAGTAAIREVKVEYDPDELPPLSEFLSQIFSRPSSSR